MAGVIQSASFSDIKCDIPELTGDNYKIWKERILLHLGWMDIDYAIRKDEPAGVTEASTPDEVEEMLMMEEGEKVNLTIQGKKKKGSAKDKGNIPPQPIIKKESACFFCKKKGHMKKDCLKFKSWFDKKGYAKPKEASGK
ncbi:hypothetical protein P8452_06978 [Trifolium repens]|nr:hypothetical protein P8452_06978 [Trifolium repens]